MPTNSREVYSLRCVDPHTSSRKGSVRLEEYLLNSTQRLEAITNLVNGGGFADRASHDWMFAQVDFIVETIGDERLELADEMRSDLLQLLLTIANLNEQMRHQAALRL